MRLIRWAAVALAIVAGCKETTPPPAEIPFSLKITVVDTSGQPVPGLQVAAFNHVPNAVAPEGPGRCGDPVRSIHAASRAVTTLLLTVNDASLVTVTIRNWSGQTVRKLIADYDVPFPGRLTLVWNGLDDEAQPVLQGIYRIQTMARSAGGIEYFHDEQLAVVLPPTDLSTGHEGITDADGVFQSTNMQQFPGLLSVPPITATDAQCLAVGDFQFTNSLTLRLYDPASQKQMLLCDLLSMTNEANEATVVWDPALAVAPAAIAEEAAQERLATQVRFARDRRSPAAWDLRICPNPFE